MMEIITAVFSGALTEIIVAVVLALLGGGGAFAWGRSQRNKGRKEAEHDFEEADRAQADAIRRRVDSDRDERLRRYDDAGWRDGK
jgi:flagellar basal body-associated protein FliL